MGVKTTITLSQVQKLFPTFSLTELQETSDGVMDTTYLLNNYVLKHYERDIIPKIQNDKRRLKIFTQNGLPTPLHLASVDEWHLYSRLKGYIPKTTYYFHIQALARFLAQFHKLSTTIKPCEQIFLEEYKLLDILHFTKKNFFAYYKKLQSLQSFRQKKEGFIHGDIFKDNTLFDGEKVGVFDFIDGGVGSFSFDIAVTLVSFNPSKRKSYTKLFLNTYNQTAPKKISLQELNKDIQSAAKLYGLLRIHKYKNPKKAKELAKFW